MGGEGGVWEERVMCGRRGRYVGKVCGVGGEGVCGMRGKYVGVLRGRCVGEEGGVWDERVVQMVVYGRREWYVGGVCGVWEKWEVCGRRGRYVG